MTKVSLKSNCRVFITGKTDSGKTYFSKNVLWPQFKRRLFHDVKIENDDILNDPNTILIRTPQQLVQAIKKGFYSILYQPIDMEGSDFNKVCEVIHKTGNFTLFLDEAQYYATATHIERFHKEILMRGRSRGVGIVNCTQRPMGCNNLLLSESEHFFIFKLNLDGDIGKVASMVPADTLNNIYSLQQYYFIYAGVYGEGFVHKPIMIKKH